MKPKDLNYIHRLQKPASAVDVVIDTDAYNQVDDLYALAYLLLSDEKLKLKGIFAAPFYSPPGMGRIRQNSSPGEGMHQSYDAIMELLDVMKRENLKEITFYGSEENLSSYPGRIRCRAGTGPPGKGVYSGKPPLCDCHSCPYGYRVCHFAGSVHCRQNCSCVARRAWVGLAYLYGF